MKVKRRDQSGNENLGLSSAEGFAIVFGYPLVLAVLYLGFWIGLSMNSKYPIIVHLLFASVPVAGVISYFLFRRVEE
jgi:hypothetical protein